MSDLTKAQRLLSADAETLLNALTERQYTRPHTATVDALNIAVRQEGLCGLAVERALKWLEIDGSKSLGRLRRTELVQLARSLQRFSNQLMRPVVAAQ